MVVKEGAGSTFRMSMGMAVPVNPRYCERADVRYVRAERASRDCVEGVSD